MGGGAFAPLYFLRKEGNFKMDEQMYVGETEKNKKPLLKESVFEWLEILVASLIAVVIVLTCLFKVVTISGPSMSDTLLNNERIIITGVFYTPSNGDIVVISRNNNNSYEATGAEPIIKRVIATEGQTVNIDFEAGVVYVDGVALEEPYTKTPTNLYEGVNFPVTVPENCVFVLGDNRNDSTDSRDPSIGDEGMIDTRYVMGKAVLRFYPFSKFGVIEK